MSTKKREGGAVRAPARPPVRLELTGAILDEISIVFSAFSHFALVFFSSLAEIAEEFKDMVVRILRRH
jgi:hypothetical protein